MNWVGGARSRVKFQGDRRLQKEFFERKKLDLKFEKLQKASKSQSTKKKKLSQDLVALRTVSNASRKAGNSPRAVKVQHIDLDHHRRVSLSGRLENRVGTRQPRVPESVELPYSPELFPSKLQLKESLSPSGEGKDARHPFKHKSNESVSSCREMASGFSSSSDTLPKPMIRKNEEETLHILKNAGASNNPLRHLESQFGVDRWTASNTSKISTETTQDFCKPPVLSTSLRQPDTKTRNPWMEEEFRLFEIKKVREQFQSPLGTPKTLGTSDHSKVSSSVDEETWFPYRYPRVQRQSKDVCTGKGDQLLKDYRNNKHLSSQTPMLPRDAENYKSSQSSLKTIWTRKDSCTDTKYQMVTSPLKVSTHPSPELISGTSIQTNSRNSIVTESIQNDRQTQSRLNHVTDDPTMVFPTFNDHMSMPSKPPSMSRHSTGSSKTERHSSLFEHQNLKLLSLLDYDSDEYQLKLKRLWLPEDFQPSPSSSSRKASRETPNTSLSVYTPVFQKHSVSKWETFLDSPEKSVSPVPAGFNVPHTPSPNFWKTPFQRRQRDPLCCFSDSRAVEGRRMSSFTQGMWNHSDSETSSTYMQTKNKIRTESSSVCHPNNLQKTASASSLYSQTSRDTSCIQRGQRGGNEMTGNSKFDWKHDLLAQRQMSPQCEKDTAAHTVPTSACIGLTTPITSVLKHQALKPLTPKLWPKKQSRAEEVLQELEQLEALSDTEDAGVGTKRKAALQHSPSKVRKVHQEPLRSQADHDWQVEDQSAVHNSGDSEMNPSRSTDGVDETQPLQSEMDGPRQDGIATDVKEQFQDSFETLPDSDPAVHNTTVLESGECTDAESDPDQSIHDIVETMVHHVVMTENRSSLTNVQATQNGRMHILWSASDTDLPESGQHSRDVFYDKPPLLQVNVKHSPDQKGKVQLETQVVSVHIQTDWSLVHVDIPSDWLPGTPLSARNGVDQGVQWESPSPQPCAVITQWQEELTQLPSDQHQPTAGPVSSERHSTPLSMVSSEEPRLAVSAIAASKDVGLNTSSGQNKTRAVFHSPMQSITLVPSSSHTDVTNFWQTSAEKSPQNLPMISIENMSTENIEISGSLSSKTHIVTEDGTSSAECQQSNRKHTVSPCQQKVPESNLSAPSKPMYCVEVSRSDEENYRQTELATRNDAVHHQMTPQQAVADSSSSPGPSAERRAEFPRRDVVHSFPHTEDKAVTQQKLVNTQDNSLQSSAQSEKSAASSAIALPVKEEALYTEEPFVSSSGTGYDSEVANHSVATSSLLVATFSPNDPKASLNLEPASITVAHCFSNMNQESSRNAKPTETDVENGISALSSPSRKSSECHNANNCGLSDFKPEEMIGVSSDLIPETTHIDLPVDKYELEVAVKQQSQPEEEWPVPVLKSDGEDEFFTPKDGHSSP